MKPLFLRLKMLDPIKCLLVRVKSLNTKYFTLLNFSFTVFGLLRFETQFIYCYYIFSDLHSAFFCHTVFGALHDTPKPAVCRAPSVRRGGQGALHAAWIPARSAPVRELRGTVERPEPQQGGAAAPVPSGQPRIRRQTDQTVHHTQRPTE